MGIQHSIDSQRQSALGLKIMWRLAISLTLVVSLWIISPLPVAAQSVGEYFQISYDPVSFSENDIHASEVFHATIHGRATCTKDLPMSVGEAIITSRVIAEDTVSGARVTLISSYTITIKPFPSKEGDTTEINQIVPLQFPAQAKSGDYDVIGEIIEAKVKIGFGWINVTEYLSHAQLMGSLMYTAPMLTPAPAPASALTPIPMPTPTPTPRPAPGECDITWWVWLIVAIAVVTTLVNIIWYLRHRAA